MNDKTKMWIRVVGGIIAGAFFMWFGQQFWQMREGLISQKSAIEQNQQAIGQIVQFIKQVTNK